MEANEEELQESGVRASTLSKMPTKRLDQEDEVFLERLHRLKNERLGYLSTVTARRKDIEALFADEENVELVKDKLPRFLAALETFKNAHVTYSLHLQDEVSFARCQEQFTLKSLRAGDFCKRVQDWTGSTEENIRLKETLS